MLTGFLAPLHSLCSASVLCVVVLLIIINYYYFYEYDYASVYGSFVNPHSEDINSNSHALSLYIIMKFADWFPYYQGIRAEFGYSTEKDQEAAKILSDMIKRKALDPKVLQRKIKGKNIIVVGAGPRLEDWKVLKYIKKNKKFVKIAEITPCNF